MIGFLDVTVFHLLQFFRTYRGKIIIRFIWSLVTPSSQRDVPIYVCSFATNFFRNVYWFIVITELLYLYTTSSQFKTTTPFKTFAFSISSISLTFPNIPQYSRSFRQFLSLVNIHTFFIHFIRFCRWSYRFGTVRYAYFFY